MASQKTAFITGVTGQDGAYLARFLLSKGYAVHGLVRWDSADMLARLRGPEFQNGKFHIHHGDVTDAGNITRLIKTIAPDEIYNLAALSHVHVSFDTPASALQANAGGALNVFEAVRALGLEASVKIYQASSSEMFGRAPAPQNETTPFVPCSPYGVAKLAAYQMARVYRESYGMFIANGILFNHESPLRGQDFVTAKIARAVAAIEAGAQERLLLGNLDSLRDWGHAADYVEGMWAMLQQGAPGDFVLATGQAYSVRDFCSAAFAHAGIALEWQSAGVAETARERKAGRVVVAVDPALFRPLEVDYLLGDAAKARDVLGWAPRTDFETLVSEMVNAERAALWGEKKSWPMAG